MAKPALLIHPTSKESYTSDDLARGWAIYSATLGAVLLTLNTTGIYASLLGCFVLSIGWHVEIGKRKNMTLHHAQGIVINIIGCGAATLTFVLCTKDADETWWPAVVSMGGLVLAFVAMITFPSETLLRRTGKDKIAHTLEQT